MGSHRPDRASGGVRFVPNIPRFIVAVPTAAGSAYRELRPEVDELVALMRPEPFYGVGASYEDFSQMSDAEVIDLLERARSFLTRRRRRG
jgi:putative phosphoribosyl transferase